MNLYYFLCLIYASLVYLLVSLVVGVAVTDGQLVDEVQLRPEEEDEHRVVLGRFFATNGQFQAARTIDRKDEAVSDSAALSGRIRHWKSDRRKKRSAAAEIPISSVNQQHPSGSSGSQTFPALSLAPAVPAEEDASSSSGPMNETTEETTKLAAELHGLSTTSTETTTAATTTTEISMIKDIVESAEESESIPELNDAPVITSNQTVVEQHEDEPESNTSTVEPEDSSESSSADKPTEIPLAPPTAAAVAVAVNRSAADDRQPAATWSTTRPSGRALSHEEEPLPWEAMSTKVIGTIIEDIQPFNNAATTAATALTTGAIAAIVMCLLLSIVTTAGRINQNPSKPTD